MNDQRVPHTTTMPDIASRADIERLVTAFYSRLFEDPVLGPIFRDVAKVDLAEHIPTFTNFWENILFRTGAYRGGFMAVHMRLHMMTQLTSSHVQRWLDYWETTVDAHFAGPRATMAKDHAYRVGQTLAQRLQMLDGAHPRPSTGYTSPPMIPRN